jgi:hypothetical protein
MFRIEKKLSPVQDRRIKRRLIRPPSDDVARSAYPKTRIERRERHFAKARIPEKGHFALNQINAKNIEALVRGQTHNTKAPIDQAPSVYTKQRILIATNVLLGPDLLADTNHGAQLKLPKIVSWL